MNIYRHKEDKKLYLIEHLIHDIKHLNLNALAGIYVIPYKWKGNTIEFLSKDHEACNLFVENNFNKIAECQKITY